MTTLSAESKIDFCKTAKWAFERAADDASAIIKEVDYAGVKAMKSTAK